VVELKATDGENLLDAAPMYWKAPFPKPSLETAFAPWNGRMPHRLGRAAGSKALLLH
jgi:hypothetical protein